MSLNNDVVIASKYFFEVLIPQFLELERAVQKQSGILSLFKKTDYANRRKAFENLSDRAQEARESISINEELKSDLNLYSLAVKLSECIEIYINMVEAQVGINQDLNRKANGEKYDMAEYSKGVKYFDMLRDSLESELPKLQSIYAAILKAEASKIENERETVESVTYVQLSEIVVDAYLKEIDNNADNLINGLREMGFRSEDCIDKEWIKYDIFLCGLSMDSMALFNLTDKNTANKIYAYISRERFSTLENEELKEYSINEIAEYRLLWDESIEESIPPFDYMFSKLIENILGENIEKYDIGSIQMMELMSLVSPLFIGKWKKALEIYTLV